VEKLQILIKILMVKVKHHTQMGTPMMARTQMV